VILFAEPPLHAEIKMRSSIMLSLILLLPDWTTKTSFSRILVKILTLVSPCNINQPHHVRQKGYTEFTFANCESSTAAGAMPRFEHI
jgi:ubiquitin-protein ligase